MESLSISGAVSHSRKINECLLFIPKYLKVGISASKALFGKYRVSVADNRELILLNRNLKFSKELIKLCKHYTSILEVRTAPDINFKPLFHESTQGELQREADKVLTAVCDGSYGRPFAIVFDSFSRKDLYVDHLERARENFENNLQSVIAEAMPEVNIESGIIKKMFIENIKPLVRFGWPAELLDVFQSPAYSREGLHKESYRAIPLLCELISRTVENAVELLVMDPETMKAKILGLKEIMDEHAMTSSLRPGSGYDSVDELSGRAFGEKQDSLAFCQLCLGGAVAEAYCGALERYKEFIGNSTDSSGDISPATVGAIWTNTLIVKSTKWNHMNMHV